MPNDNTTPTRNGFESGIWRAAGALRSNMDAAAYKHVLTGLIFFKYSSGAFE